MDGDGIMSEKLGPRILSWLETQGYGVEMKVATSLNAAGVQTIQSWFYSDPETEISRELDVLGKIDDVMGLLTVYSVVECKKSSKPWILFTSERAVFNRVLSFAIMSDKTRLAITKNILRMKDVEWFMKNGRAAYGITEAFTSKEDETFKAGMTVTKAAISLLKDEVGRSEFSPLSFFFPTVVLDGRLFECFLDPDGVPTIEEIDSAFLLFPMRVGGHLGSSIRVVTLNAFDNYCRDLKLLYLRLRNLLEKERKELATSLGMPIDDLKQMDLDLSSG